jgi:hypothetical protein
MVAIMVCIFRGPAQGAKKPPSCPNENFKDKFGSNHSDSVNKATRFKTREGRDHKDRLDHYYAKDSYTNDREKCVAVSKK